MLLPEPGNKYIVGWVKLREGCEAEFDRIAKPYIATCREEPECRFFHMLRTPEDPLTVLVCECFTHAQAQDVHLQRPHVRAFLNALGEIALVGEFENIIAGEITPDRVDFANARGQ